MQTSTRPVDRHDTKGVIRTLRARLESSANPVDVLEDAFRGRCAVVLSAGPSLRRWPQVLAAERDRDPLVVCVKQALLEVGRGCDLHFVNPYNHRRYGGVDGERLVIYTDVAGAPATLGRRDVTFRIVKQRGAGIAESLAARRNFADWELPASGVERPWGPGIMYESVLYTLLHLGVEEVVTVGWDIADDKGGNRHFYDAAATESGSWPRKRSLQSRARRIPAVRSLVRFGFHWLGKTYNPPALLAGEAEVVSESLEDCLRWFESRGMKVRIVSDSRWVRRHCPAFVRSM